MALKGYCHQILLQHVLVAMICAIDGCNHYALRNGSSAISVCLLAVGRYVALANRETALN
jgi:hypothetical protein